MEKMGKLARKAQPAAEPKSVRGLALDQLRTLLERYPRDGLDIEGIVMDFLGRSGQTLDAVFSINHLIYTSLFTGHGLDKGQRLLKAIGDREARAELSERCSEKYPVVTEIISRELSINRAMTDSAALIENPSSVLGYPIHYVVWHLSDVHFGSFNKLESNPRELAFLVAQLAADHRSLTPDVVIVSGDISSKALPSEFEDFKTFCVELSQALWNGRHPERILMVPGNHDVTWLPNGTADCLRQFSSLFCDDQVCVSPFGPETVLLANRFEVLRSNPKPSTVPPIALVHDQEKNIKFLLLVSGYFSGNVPSKVRQTLSESHGTDQDLQELLRVDAGEVSQEYLFNISNLPAVNSLCLGIIHHNPVQYGVETCQNSLAPKLMEKLWSRGVPLLLHGHTHLSEPKSNRRPAAPGLAYPVPAPTLTSITTAGSGRGINIHFIGPESTNRQIDTLVWNYSPSTAFLPTDAVWRYRIVIQPDSCSVDHLL
jgi:calcineurin-like phosphoesterase family protein